LKKNELTNESDWDISLKWLESKLNGFHESFVLLFFAGHGCSSGQTHCIQCLNQKILPLSKLYSVVRSHNKCHCLVILDSCQVILKANDTFSILLPEVEKVIIPELLYLCSSSHPQGISYGSLEKIPTKFSELIKQALDKDNANSYALMEALNEYFNITNVLPSTLITSWPYKHVL